jgi:hypothetical protein
MSTSDRRIARLRSARNARWLTQKHVVDGRVAAACLRDRRHTPSASARNPVLIARPGLCSYSNAGSGPAATDRLGWTRMPSPRPRPRSRPSGSVVATIRQPFARLQLALLARGRGGSCRIIDLFSACGGPLGSRIRPARHSASPSSSSSLHVLCARTRPTFGLGLASMEKSSQLPGKLLLPPRREARSRVGRQRGTSF